MTARGAYTADRAAALAGVPKSTVHYWARTGVLEPSVSPDRVKLWSYTDLVALRFIYWLRQPKRGGASADIPATSMPAVRKALQALRDLDLDVWSPTDGPHLAVDRGGRVFLAPGDELQEASGQMVAAQVLSLVEPFAEAAGIRGPDLARPRPDLRIVPGKLSGSPHVAGTRVETEALAALEQRRFGVAQLKALYPYIGEDDIGQALDLEHQLASNLRAA
ncbi:MAG: MerR family transcriptional regulator [Thermoleophilia bacterium]